MSRFTPYLSAAREAELADVARRLMAPGKGILAADESVANCGSKLKEINVSNTEENRRRYREVLFTADAELSDYISGVIMFDETARQRDSNGLPFIECLQRRGIIPGIKVDKGVVHLAGTHRENTTVGLDGLKERCDEYKSMGMQFTKWRGVVKVSAYNPSNLAIKENTNNLARFASISQQSGLVPMVVPEVLSDGDHDIDTARKITEDVLAHLFKALADHRVFLEGLILKPNMILPGHNYGGQVTLPAEIGMATVQTMHRRVPSAVAGICFLSGGQGEDSATINLNEINKVKTLNPWPLTFSFGRALQASVLHVWNGNDDNKRAAQNLLIKRAKANGLASLGLYRGGMESVVKDRSVFYIDDSTFGDDVGATSPMANNQVQIKQQMSKRTIIREKLHDLDPDLSETVIAKAASVMVGHPYQRSEVKSQMSKRSVLKEKLHELDPDASEFAIQTAASVLVGHPYDRVEQKPQNSQKSNLNQALHEMLPCSSDAAIQKAVSVLAPQSTGCFPQEAKPQKSQRSVLKDVLHDVVPNASEASIQKAASVLVGHPYERVYQSEATKQRSQKSGMNQAVQDGFSDVPDISISQATTLPDEASRQKSTKSGLNQALHDALSGLAEDPFERVASNLSHQQSERNFQQEARQQRSQYSAMNQALQSVAPGASEAAIQKAASVLSGQRSERSFQQETRQQRSHNSALNQALYSVVPGASEAAIQKAASVLSGQRSERNFQQEARQQRSHNSALNQALQSVVPGASAAAIQKAASVLSGPQSERSFQQEARQHRSHNSSLNQALQSVAPGASEASIQKAASVLSGGQSQRSFQQEVKQQNSRKSTLNQALQSIVPGASEAAIQKAASVLSGQQSQRQLEHEILETSQTSMVYDTAPGASEATIMKASSVLVGQQSFVNEAKELVSPPKSHQRQVAGSRRIICLHPTNGSPS